jgi:hypothetical protein
VTMRVGVVVTSLRDEGLQLVGIYGHVSTAARIPLVLSADIACGIPFLQKQPGHAAASSPPASPPLPLLPLAPEPGLAVYSSESPLD